MAEYDRKTVTTSGIVIFSVRGRPVEVWLKGGEIPVHPLLFYRMTVQQAIEYLEEFILSGDSFCAYCSKRMKREMVAGSQGNRDFCQKCWDVFKNKKRNKKICSGCGHPKFECGC